MAERLGEAVLELSTDDSKLRKGLADGEKQAEGFSKRAGKSMAKLGAGLSLAVTGPVLGMGKIALDELNEIQAANAQTEATIKRLGNATSLTTGQIQKQAGALQQLSGFDDQAIQSGQNLILALGNIDTATAQGTKTFQRASQVMVDMAATMKTDPVSAGKILARALADPEKAAGKLGRMGIILTEQQQDQVKALVKAGKAGQAQAMVLGLMEQKMKGAAAAQGKNLGPQLDILKDKLTSAAAGILQQLLPSILKLIGKVGGLVDKFEGLSPRIKTVIAIAAVLAAALGPVLLIAGTMVMAVGALGGALAAVTLPMLGIVAAVALVAVALVMLWKKSATFRKIVTGAFKAVRAGVMQVLGELKKTLQAWGTAAQGLWKRHGDGILRIALAAFNGIKRAVGPIMSGIKNVIIGILRLLRGDWRGAWQALKSGALSILKGLASAITGLGSLFVSATKSIGTAIIDGIVKGLKAAKSKVMEWLKGMAADALQAVKDKLGIGSPSRAFADQVGLPIGQGIAEGIKASRAMISAALAAATPAQAMSSRAALALPAAAGAGASVGAGGPVVGAINANISQVDVDVPNLFRRISWEARKVGAFQ